MHNKDKHKKHNPFAENKQEENQEVNTEQETRENLQDEVQEEIKQEISQEDSLAKELEELKNQYIRMAADFDNYRKRQAQERESLLKYGAEDTLKKLLPVIDSFDRAQKTFDENSEPDKFKEGFEVINKQFIEALEKIGLQKIETEGKEFDPNLHEAVMQTPSSEHPDHTIIQELQSGYLIGERVIRPALVNVAVSE